jgi:hypothetical protein
MHVDVTTKTLLHDQSTLAGYAPTPSTLWGGGAITLMIVMEHACDVNTLNPKP